VTYSSDASARSEDIARTAEELAAAAREFEQKDEGGSIAPIEEGVRALVDSLEELAVARISEQDTQDAAEVLIEQLERTDPAYKQAEAEAASIEEMARARLINEAAGERRSAVADAASDAKTLLALVEELRLENEQLREALESRLAIGEAKGIIMANSSCGPDEAFDILRRASQRQNVKLRDLAVEMVAKHTAALPRDP
jgi:hypothetical protein